MGCKMSTISSPPIEAESLLRLGQNMRDHLQIMRKDIQDTKKKGQQIVKNIEESNTSTNVVGKIPPPSETVEKEMKAQDKYDKNILHQTSQVLYDFAKNATDESAQQLPSIVKIVAATVQIVAKDNNELDSELAYKAYTSLHQIANTSSQNVDALSKAIFDAAFFMDQYAKT